MAEKIGGKATYVGKPSVKPIYYWQLSGSNAYDFCKLIAPYLKEKKRQAELIIEYRDLGLFSRYNKPPKEVIEQRGKIQRELRGLKHAFY